MFFDNRPWWELLPSEKAEREIEREKCKNWQLKMTSRGNIKPKPGFDWFSWGPIMGLIAMVFIGTTFLSISGRAKASSVFNQEAKSEIAVAKPAVEKRASIPEANGLILKKISIPSAKLLIFELELANGERTALPVDSETYESRKVGELTPLEPPKKNPVNQKLEYY